MENMNDNNMPLESLSPKDENSISTGASRKSNIHEKLDPTSQLSPDSKSGLAPLQGTSGGSIVDEENNSASNSSIKVDESEKHHHDVMLENSRMGAIQETSDGQQTHLDQSAGNVCLQCDRSGITATCLPKRGDFEGNNLLVASIDPLLPPAALASIAVKTPAPSSPRYSPKYGSPQFLRRDSFRSRYAKSISMKSTSLKGSVHLSPSKLAIKGNIDTTAPFESVKEAVSKFGGIVDWKAHKLQAMERSKLIEQELGKVQNEIPEHRKQLEVVETEKVKVLKELESTKRQVEDLKLNLERAQTEEEQAKQDYELSQLRLDEMEQGIADEASVAAKAQLEVAKARYKAAISELESYREELEEVQQEYVSLLTEKEIAMKKAEEVISESKEMEKIVEELTIELIATKESLESAHAAHMEAEEQTMGTAMASDQDSHYWEKELKQAEDEVQRLNQQIQTTKDLKSKLDTASALLLDLKAELAAYMESKLKQDTDEEGNFSLEVEESKKSHTDIQAAVASAKTELDQVRANIEKATAEVNCLKTAATPLESQLETEKAALASLRQREGIASVAISSLEAELDRTKLEMAQVETNGKDVREKMVKLPKQLQQAAQEADQAQSLAQVANEELSKAEEEVEQAKAGVSTLEGRLLAAQKEIEAAKVSEKLAVAAIKALEESGSTKNNSDMDSSAAVTLSLEEYYELSKQAHEAEEQANTRVASAISQIEVAKESELKTLEKLEEMNQEIAARRESLKLAKEKAEKAKEGKLGVEQELRNWRAENEKRRKAGDSIQADSAKSPISSFEKRQEPGNDAVPGHPVSSPEAHLHGSNTITDSSPEVTVVKKKKKSFFPRLFMFLGRRKHASKSAKNSASKST